MIKDMCKWCKHLDEIDEGKFACCYNWENPIPMKEVENCPVREMEKDADLFAVQMYVDGFGNDTFTWAICKTKEEAVAFCEEKSKDEFVIRNYCQLVIMPQKWGSYENAW